MYLVNVFFFFTPFHFFLPPKIFCGTTCEFAMNHIALGYSNSGLKQFLTSQNFDGRSLSPESKISGLGEAEKLW